jgi:hypothetical protein
MVLTEIACGVGSLYIARQTARMCLKRHLLPIESFADRPSPLKRDLLRAAVVSRLSYEEPSSFIQKAKTVCPTSGALALVQGILPNQENQLGFFDTSKTRSSHEDTQAYAWLSGNDMYMVFRGTEDLQDIIADIDVRLHVIRDNVKVHRGFYEQFEAISDEIEKYLKEASSQRKIDNIIISGHSLGGGLATIASTHFGLLYPDSKVTCITFGSPRVGNREFTNYFNSIVSQSLRIYDEEDPVPMVPMSNRFQHVGHDQADVLWWLRPFVAFAYCNMLKPFAAHNMDQYINKIIRLKEI